MRAATNVAAGVLCAMAAGAAQQPATPRTLPGTRLDAMSWQAAEPLLKADPVVVVPLAPGSIEHGPHLPLGTDQTLADYFARRAIESLDVVVAPALSYHYYPAFQEYPGSTSLALTTARDLTADAARSLARSGARRFHVLDTNGLARPALVEAAKVLEGEGILLRSTEPRARLEAVARTWQPRQPSGRHADEIETSLMLHIDPASVDMSRAPRQLGNESVPLYLTRGPGAGGTFSPTGVWGDASLATAEKGRALAEALMEAIRSDIGDLRRAALPARRTAPVAAGPSRAVPAGAEPAMPGHCTGGDERTIRGIGSAYAFAWANQDAAMLAGLWSAQGDMVHPDGFVERTAETIRQNRTILFMRPEYRGSRHGLYIGQIRCLTREVAVADAKWELRGVSSARGDPLPPMDGLSTLVLKRVEGGTWGIEAYRYTMKQTHAPTQPTMLNRPGLPDKQ